MNQNTQRKKILIFGAGMTGLAAGRELARQGHEVHVFEADDHVGGLASTFHDDQGFTYDNGPRFIFSTLARKIGIDHLCEPVIYYENLRVGGRYYRFPFGFVWNPLFCLSVGLAMVLRGFRRKPRSLGQFLRTYYGGYFSGRVLAPLIGKWAGVPVDQMSIDFASRLLPTNFGYILYSLIKKLRGGVTEDYYKKGRYIVYPKGSNAEIFKALMKQDGLHVHLNHRVEKLDHDHRKINRVQINGEWLQADAYLSTIPIHILSQTLAEPKPEKVQTWKKLTYRSIVILFIKINRNKVLETLWTWFPETKYLFYRVSEYKNALKDLAPADKTLISIEIACKEGDEIWKLSKEELFKKLLPDLTHLYGLRESEVIGLDLKRSACAYPVLKKETEDLQRNLAHQTPYENLFIAGRTGMFQYRMLEGSFESAIEAAQMIKTFLHSGRSDPPIEIEAVTRDSFGKPLVVPE